MIGKYCIGIDLGTTNTVVAFTRIDQIDEVARRRNELPAIDLLPIAQIVGPGQIESRTSLPSFVYLPREHEREALSIRADMIGVDSLPTSFPTPDQGVVGEYARTQAADNPQRVVVAAKSWLCHTDVSRTEAILPWQSPAEVEKVSALECTRRILQHVIAAWHAAHPDAPIDQQQVVLTVPASFDPAARDLTRQAAIDAGLDEHFVLLEEPQAAVYRYLSSVGNDWREELSAGDTLLVVDVGGGTTDLTLVQIDQLDGELVLQRQAVGNHLLIGGDNMDLALAYQAAEQFKAQGHDLDPWQSTSLWHACRAAKEQLLRDDEQNSVPISVLGRGSSLIGGTVTTEFSKEKARDLLVEGFFPVCKSDERPQRQVSSGFQDIGLPYESDPAITKQVAAFLADHHVGNQQDGGEATRVTHLLLNGGVFVADVFRDRMRATIASWFDQQPKMLSTVDDLNTSVAVGAVYYGYTKQTGGIRIRGGTPRAYYIGIETAGLAIPGAPRPLRAVCVAAQGMEEGTQQDVPGEQVGVVVGKPAVFRFFSSATRAHDTPGTKLDRWSPDELQESEPIELTLELHGEDDVAGSGFMPVRFESKITELGMFELWCHSVQTDQKWKMEFNTRQSQQPTP